MTDDHQSGWPVFEQTRGPRRSKGRSAPDDAPPVHPNGPDTRVYFEGGHSERVSDGGFQSYLDKGDDGREYVGNFVSHAHCEAAVAHRLAQ
jgi:hypothetical protein